MEESIAAAWVAYNITNQAYKRDYPHMSRVVPLSFECLFNIGRWADCSHVGYLQFPAYLTRENTGHGMLHADNAELALATNEHPGEIREQNDPDIVIIYTQYQSTIRSKIFGPLAQFGPATDNKIAINMHEETKFVDDIDPKTHLPEWYLKWRAGEPAPRSSFEVFYEKLDIEKISTAWPIDTNAPSPVIAFSRGYVRLLLVGGSSIELPLDKL